ncbi:MAG: MotA/TolQ/ExbB proton channel family protein [Candidatus Omnitrophota bacterium]|nr:MotA/TolQ/ExbB proton channel family protein [Candidatus Omnitrophota bacterium]
MDLYRMSLLKTFLTGGPIMWPILFCSIFALAIVLEKFWHLNAIKIDTQKFLKKIFDSLSSRETKEAAKLCDKTNSPIARILKAGILKHNQPKSQIREAMEDVSLYEIPKLERNLTTLASIAHISPLLGLLGTVMGMVRCFQTIQMKSTTFHPVSPGDLAGGIWEALLTTVAGLVVAIPTYVLYNYLVSRVNATIIEMEKAATELVNFLSER